MNRILSSVAMLTVFSACFMACDKDDADFKFAHTSWTSYMSDGDATGNLTLSFSDSQNGILQGDFHDKDGNTYTSYHVFTYEAVDGDGKIHIADQYGVVNNGPATRLSAGLDVPFTLCENSDLLEFKADGFIHGMSSAGYKAISLPEKGIPDPVPPVVNLSEEMLHGRWTSMMPIFMNSIYSFRKTADGLVASIWIYQINVFTTAYRMSLVEESDLYPDIQNSNTVVFYADKEHGKARFYWTFIERESGSGVYLTTLRDAEDKEIVSDYIVKE